MTHIKRNRIRLLLLTLLVSCFLVTNFVSAAGLVSCGLTQDDPETRGIDESTRCTLCHLIQGFQNLVNYGLRIVLVVSMAAITIAGVMYVVSAGNPGMMTTAKTFILNVAKGLGIVLGSWLIVNTTIWLLAPKGDMGIGKSSWWKIDCSLVPANLVKPTKPQCSDGTNNNDGDLLVDFSGPPKKWNAAGDPIEWDESKKDPDCLSPTDDSELPLPQCSDGADNDGDWLVDYFPVGGAVTEADAGNRDPGCTSYDDNDEGGEARQACGYRSRGQCVYIPGLWSQGEAIFNRDARCPDPATHLTEGANCQTGGWWCCANRIPIGSACEGLGAARVVVGNTPTASVETVGTCRTTGSSTNDVIDVSSSKYPKCVNGATCYNNGESVVPRLPAPVLTCRAAYNGSIWENRLTWTWSNPAVTEADSLTRFEIRQYDSITRAWTPLGAGGGLYPPGAYEPSTRSAMDNNNGVGINSNVRYQYEVVAVGTNSNKSDPATCALGIDKPSATVVPNPGNPTHELWIKLSYTGIADPWANNEVPRTIDHFEVWKLVSGTPTSKISGDITAGALARTDTGLTPGTTYQYRVKAVSLAGNESYVDVSGTTSGVAVVPVLGECGTADGVSMAVAPTVGLCNMGAASAVTATATGWAWQCQGSAGTPPDLCSATKSAPPPPTTIPAGATLAFIMSPGPGLPGTRISSVGAAFLWNAVDNAVRYELKQNGVVIGTITPPRVEFTLAVLAEGVPTSFQVFAYAESGPSLASNTIVLTRPALGCGYSPNGGATRWGSCMTMANGANFMQNYYVGQPGATNTWACPTSTTSLIHCWSPIDQTVSEDCGGNHKTDRHADGTAWAIGVCNTSCVDSNSELISNTGMPYMRFPVCASGLKCCFTTLVGK